MIVKVVSGRHAKALNAIQAEAIAELLRWCRDHRPQHEHTQGHDQDQDQAVPAGPPGPGQAGRERHPE
jgi:hypothetical protein